MHLFELKLRSGKRVEYHAKDSATAVQLANDMNPADPVIAWRDGTEPIVFGIPRIEE